MVRSSRQRTCQLGSATTSSQLRRLISGTTGSRIWQFPLVPSSYFLETVTGLSELLSKPRNQTLIFQLRLATSTVTAGLR